MLMEPMRHFDLLAQGSGDWENIIFLVIVGFFWLAGALAKVLAARKGAARQQRPGRPTPQTARPRETWQQRLARKAQEMHQAAQTERQRLEEQTRERMPQTQPRPAGEISIRTDAAGDSVMVYQPPADTKRQQPARQQQAREAIPPARRQVAVESPKPPGPRQVTVSPAVSPPGASDLHPLAIVDFDDPDALKKAVLHYEILGRPLALRDLSREAAEF